MRGTLLLPQSAFDLMTMALFGMLSLSGVQSVWCFEIRSEHIDIDAASFGIIECKGYFPVLAFHFVPVDNSWIQDFTICFWESFIAHLRHDPLQHWTVLVASAFQFHKTVEWLLPYIPSTCCISRLCRSSWQKSPRNTWQLSCIEIRCIQPSAGNDLFN
jgi:hypothetical protein